MRDVTLLISHPDDEALFCWPVLDRVKRIICASNDSANMSRKWCSERGKSLDEVGELLGADVIQLQADSEFYRMPTRDGTLKRHCETLLRHLADAEIVFTHNAWGEYGNLDHILMHHIGRVWQKETRRELLVSDIAVTEAPAWIPVTPWMQAPIAQAVMWEKENEKRYSHVIDRPLYDRIKAIYDARACWTWSFPVVERARVYSLC